MSGVINKSTWIVTYTVYYADGNKYQSSDSWHSYYAEELLPIIKKAYPDGDVIIDGLWGPFE